MAETKTKPTAASVDEYLASSTMRFVGKPIPPAPGEEGWKDTVRAEAGVTGVDALEQGVAAGAQPD